MFSQYLEQYKALSDNYRLRILEELCTRGRVCVCDMCEIIDLKQSKLSYHLKVLLDANLIIKDKCGTWSYYELNKEELKKFMPENTCILIDKENPNCGC